MEMWQPSAERIRRANVTKFIEQIATQESLSFDSFHSFYDWTLREANKFWEAVWDFCDIVASTPYRCVIQDEHKMPGASWFPGSRLNFAENLLRFRDEKVALIFWGEDKVKRYMTYAELYRATACLAAKLRDMGVRPGDRVAGYMPNLPETVIAMLASTSLGAVWSSCSPDFGVEGVIDRFGQIEPKVLFTSDGYFHKGKTFESGEKVPEVLQSIPSIQHVVVASYTRNDPRLMAGPLAQNVHDFAELLDARSPPTLRFEQLPFEHPLYIMYSSGTTGKPKCIVHSSGGTLIEHLKELVLHVDLKRDDNIFYATTCGWMMWNWLVSSLAVGATVVLYDGAISVHEMQILFDLAEEEEISVFGTSAGFISAVNKAGLQPAKTHKLNALRAILSTGSPLVPENFDYVYRHIKEDVCLASISGGTDIIGCFALGCPVIPVHRGELQTRSLGYAVNVFSDDGKPLVGQKGELVCTAPFPSMPICFWNDPDGVKFHDAYFAKYDNVWHHGDYVSLTEHHGMIFYGRSDAVLNPGGVRIGTAEIYRQLEQFEAIENSVAVGQEWQGDTRVVLFVKLRDTHGLDEALQEEIRTAIGKNVTPRHVPKKIIRVKDIPVTRSGKISEIAVRNVIHGIDVKNKEALANPEAVDLFTNLEELQC